MAVKKKAKSGRSKESGAKAAKLRAGSDDLRADARRNRDRLIEAADELQKREAPDVALEQWMLRFVGYIAAKRGMAESLKTLYASNSALFARVSGAVPQTMQRLVNAAAEAGLIRKDIQSSDLLQVLFGLYSAPDSPDWRERSRRLVSLLMDGLRTVPKKR